MKMFLDTANVTELREGVAMGLVDGCTANPSLIAKEKRSLRPLLEEICSIVSGDVSLEVVAADFEGMMKEGKELAQITANVVKCPLTRDAAQGREAPLG
jgi:transaldolase